MLPILNQSLWRGSGKLEDGRNIEINGTVNGSQFAFHTQYVSFSITNDLSGTIASDGTFSGNGTDNSGVNIEMKTLSGAAKKK